MIYKSPTQNIKKMMTSRLIIEELLKAKWY